MLLPLKVRKQILSSPIVCLNLKETCIQIAKNMNINYQSVLSSYYRLFRSEKPPVFTKNFTYLFERYIAVFISSMSERGQLFSLKDVLRIFISSTPKGKTKPTYRFLHGWLKRHADLVKISDVHVIESS